MNVRDVTGLSVDPDGFVRGWIEFTTAGFPDGTPVLGGDFFQVDPGNDFATGDKMLRRFALCDQASIRLLDFGAGTRFVVYLANPQGDIPAVDPPSFTVQVLNESGTPLAPVQFFWTADTVLELTAADITPAAFGTLVFGFSNSSGGYVYPEYSAHGRFSAGMGSQCEVP